MIQGVTLHFTCASSCSAEAGNFFLIAKRWSGASAKSWSTRHDLKFGVGNALEGLERDSFPDFTLAVLSTSTSTSARGCSSRPGSAPPQPDGQRSVVLFNVPNRLPHPKIYIHNQVDSVQYRSG